jgi:nucleotide-binding universal stress UspA family protein
MKEIRNILFPCDLTENASKIVPFLTMIAEKFDGTVVVFHVVEDLAKWGGFYVPHPSLQDFQAQAQEGAAKAMDAFVTEHLGGCRKLEKRVVSGDPATEILKAVEAEQIDAVVMGTHGRKGLERTIFGSVAENVVKKAPVPVFIVNPYKAHPVYD